MVRRDVDKNQAKLGIMTYDHNVPKDHIARFVVDFVEEGCDDLKIKDKKKKKGNTPFPIRSMLKLLIYAKLNHIESARIIADMAMYHDIYKFVCDGITPSTRSIQRYKNEYGRIFQGLLKLTLKKASDEGFTDFNHVCIDGTIKKAFNSNDYVISKKETQILLNYYNGLLEDEDKLKELHKPAKRILKNKKLSSDDKIELLYDIETQFTFTGQDRIHVNDVEARFMKGKKGNFLVAYNIQSAVDYDSKMICAINVSQNPTDHYKLPEIADKAIENIGTKPDIISADTIYLNQISLNYLADKEIEGLIPTRKENKERIGKLNPNPYHKDNFHYDSKEDVFICPEGQKLSFYKKYTEQNPIEDQPDKIRRIYNNYEACKNCDKRNKCISTSQSHKTITEYGSELQNAMRDKMEKEEYQQEYSKRAAVEGHFGTLKEEYHIEKEYVIGLVKTEERLSLDALAYNIKRLYNMKNEIKNNKDDIKDFCERTAITYQLELDVTIS